MFIFYRLLGQLSFPLAYAAKAKYNGIVYKWYFRHDLQSFAAPNVQSHLSFCAASTVELSYSEKHSLGKKILISTPSDFTAIEMHVQR